VGRKKPASNDREQTVSRRAFFRQSLGTGVAASLTSMLPAAAVSPPSASPKPIPSGIVIHVASPAGPPPLGAPVETSVPFPRGELRSPDKLAVVGPDGKPVLAQMRSGLDWPDGTTRWLVVVFEASAGPGDYVLLPGDSPSASLLVVEENGNVMVDSGQVAFTVAQSGGDWPQAIAAPGTDGKLAPVVNGTAAGDLVLTRHDGATFRASLAGESRSVHIEERGPVRARIRLEGECHAEDGQKLFNFIIRWTVYRGRPEIFAVVTWINATDQPSEQLRDVRMVFPFEFAPHRLVIGCETGVYDGPFRKDFPIHILQDDYNRYWARKHNPDGRVQNLSSGGCNGERCPGWLYIANDQRRLGIWVPNFWQEYPNELALRQGELSVGLWPERAADHLLSKPLLPAKPEKQERYKITNYWPVIPHPYIAFLDPEKKCLDARQGMAKTQEIVLSVWAGRGDPATFEKKWWSQSLQPVRGHPDPAYVASTEALGPLAPRDPKTFPQIEPLFDDSFGWLDRHIDQLKCYGKFDYGDFKYFTAATDYTSLPGEKWGDMGEMPREGYWHNNERDALLGLLLYYYRTADPAAWQRCEIVARHLLDVDLAHYPHWGLWTHTYGHCYLALGGAGAPDHSWLLGTLAWASLSGDPVAWDWVNRCGERLRSWKLDFAQVDARTGAVHLHMMCQFHSYTGDARYLEAAKAPVEAFVKLQNPDGSWPAYMGNMRHPRMAGFVEHVVVALADYYALSGEARLAPVIDKAFTHLFGEGGDFPVEPGETPLALYALGVMAQRTGKARYLEIAKSCLRKLREKQNQSSDPETRGDLWAGWGVNNAAGSKGTGRPRQFLGQTRPLSPACLLAYSQPCLGAMAKWRSGLGIDPVLSAPRPRTAKA
jgi:hypothetical protein